MSHTGRPILSLSAQLSNEQGWSRFFTLPPPLPSARLCSAAVRRYYQEQRQINGGAMDHYVLWGAQSTNAITGAVYPTSTGWALQY